jgi:hypothetical protein
MKSKTAIEIPNIEVEQHMGSSLRKGYKHPKKGENFSVELLLTNCLLWIDSMSLHLK